MIVHKIALEVLPTKRIIMNVVAMKVMSSIQTILHVMVSMHVCNEIPNGLGKF